MKKILIILFPLVILMPFAFADDSNVGSVEWKKQIVSPNSFVDIIVKDDDMNKKEYPNFADKFSIFVWSDTSLDGLEIPVVETGVYSGIFKGSVYITDSGETLNNRLVSMPGDILYAKYVDFTLPDAGMDFTSGEIVLNPGDSRKFNILFGPNIGYGGTEFKYDPSKRYTLRIDETFGSASIPLKLD